MASINGGTLVIGDQRLRMERLPDAARAVAARGQLTIGVRPEALELTDASGDGILAGTVVHVEQLGHETLVHVQVGEARIVARVDGMVSPTREARVGLSFDPAGLYVFDADGSAVAGPSRTT